MQLGAGTRLAYDAVREVIPFAAEDCYLAPLIEAAYRLVASGRLRAAVLAGLGSVCSRGPALGVGRAAGMDRPCWLGAAA